MPERVRLISVARRTTFGVTITSGLFAIVVAFSCGGAQASTAPPGDLARALETRVKEFSLHKEPVIDGLLTLAYEYKLPLAIEYVDADLVRRPFEVSRRNVTVRQAVVALVMSLPQYRVDFSGGLVQVYSPNARRDPSSLLNMSISHFQVDHVDALSASFRLWGEVFARLHPGQGYAGHISGGALAPSGPKVTLDLRNAKVYEILNAIVVQDGGAMWLVQHPPEGLSHFGGNLWYIWNLNPAGKDFILGPIRELFPTKTGITRP